MQTNFRRIIGNQSFGKAMEELLQLILLISD